MPKGVSHKLDLISSKSPQFCLGILKLSHLMVNEEFNPFMA